MTYLVRDLRVMGTTGRLVLLPGADPAAAVRALDRVEAGIRRLARELTRFDPASDLERLNDDPREVVPVPPRLATAIAAGLDAHRRSGGLVDCGLGAQIIAAGYDRTFDELRPGGPPRGGAGRGPRGAARVRLRGRVVGRPPGLRIDLGGIAKGLAADGAAALLQGFPRATVDLGGDLRSTGTAARLALQEVAVLHPVTGERIATLRLADGGVATSSTLARAWGTGHHLLHPATGRPAATGIVQATARAATATDAERLAKQALLCGARAARGVLRDHGGVLVHADGAVEEVRPA